MLDVSVRAGILNLLLEMKERLNLTMLYITHDLSTARYMCDRIGVMYKGRLVEIGPTNQIIANPAHPYTKALVSVVKDLACFMQERETIIKDGQVNSSLLTACGKNWPQRDSCLCLMAAVLKMLRYAPIATTVPVHTVLWAECLMRS
jgi:ABC-type oligopeptide transport system ATPase subunit